MRHPKTPPKRPTGRPPLFKHEHAFTMRLDMADYLRALAIKPQHIPLTTWMRSIILAEIDKLEKAQKKG